MFILLIIYLTMLFVVFCFCISVSEKKGWKVSLKGKKLSLKNLTIPQPCEQNQWFWDELNMPGLTPLLTSGYENISHGFVYTMSERWHEETSSFHLPVGEMTVTLDDVACLQGIPITRRFLPDHHRVLLTSVLVYWWGATRSSWIGVISCLRLTHRRNKTSELMLSWHVLRRFCCSCLAGLFFAARTTKILICCGCLRCKIWTSWIAGHGVGCDLLSYMSSYLLPPTNLWPPVVVTWPCLW